jgi:TPP-dependent pyruvate/acetoin dehydrogenase alpha subunit
MIHPEEVEQIYKDVAAEITEAVTFAEAGSPEPVEHLTRFTYAERAA